MRRPTPPLAAPPRRDGGAVVDRLGGAALAGLLALAGCAAAEARPAAIPVAAAAPGAAGTFGLIPGESLTFDLRIGGLQAGDATLAVGQPGLIDGHHALVVTSRARTTGAVALIKPIVDQATTTIDVDTGAPLRLEAVVENGDKSYTASGTFLGSRADLAVTRPGDRGPSHVRFDLRGQPAYETHAAMAQLRGWRAPAGTRRTVWVIGGRRLWRVDLTFAGSETVGTALGNRRAIRLSGQAYRARGDLSVESREPGRTFDVWVSDDADRVPLRVVARTELGDVAMELTEYSRD
jgi:hypothetical protein